jgi:hypothetical protein
LVKRNESQAGVMDHVQTFIAKGETWSWVGTSNKITPKTTARPVSDKIKLIFPHMRDVLKATTEKQLEDAIATLEAAKLE